jgi:hypothetical protein
VPPSPASPRRAHPCASLVPSASSPRSLPPRGSPLRLQHASAAPSFRRRVAPFLLFPPPGALRVRAALPRPAACAASPCASVRFPWPQ